MKPARRIDPALILIIPLLRLLGGRVYSLPITTLTKRREPWTSCCLLIGLGITIFLLGHLALGVSVRSMILAWIGSSIAYFLFQIPHRFRQHIESFFVAHMIALTLISALAGYDSKIKKQHKSEPQTGISSKISKAF